MRKKIFTIILMLFFISTGMVISDEGMYLPHKISEGLLKKMKNMGFELTKKDIFNSQGNSLSQAVINLGGGTGSFVSPKGLILTNHHVAFGAAQRQSSIKTNLIEKGYLAKNIKDEIPAPGYKAYILKEVKGVTDLVLSGTKGIADPQERYKKIEKNIKKIIKKEEGNSDDYKCRVKSVFGGINYYLNKYLVLRDIRIVYIPSRNIGEFGGDIDNWMWPRHTGDFSFLRAYVGSDGKPADYSKQNIPYNPKKYLKFSIRDIDEGDLAIVMGYPGSTNRHLTSIEVKYYIKEYYPESIKLFKNWIQIMESDSEKSQEAKIKNAGMIKGLNNAYKNHQGMLEGLKKIDLVEKKEREEKKLREYINNNSELRKKYKGIIDKYFSVIKESQKLSKRDRMISLLSFSSRMLSFALTLNKWSIEKQKKDIDRDPGYMKRDIPNLKMRLKLGQRSLYIPTDKKILKFFFLKALKLPEKERIKTIDKHLEGKSEKQIENYIDNLYKNSRLNNLEFRLQAFDLNRDEIIKLNDPFINFAMELQKERDIIKDKNEILAGEKIPLKRKYMKVFLKSKKGTVYPDANGTLRLNYGVVKGYSPRDAVFYTPQTTLKGVVEKDKNEWPFIVPEKIKQVYNKKNYGDYSDPELKDVSVNFLTTNDSTGGNSGSPLINGKGELIGLLFDGNYESISADYLFNPSLTRTISVDSRYIVFVTDKVDNATNILNELEIVK